MSDFLKRVKGLFVYEEEDTAKDTPKKDTPKAEKPVHAPEVPKIALDPAKTGGKVNQKFLDILLGALENNNQEGFDYLEFRKSLQSLKSVEPDASKRIQSAYAMSKTMGTDKNIILQSAKQYLNILAQENNKFDNAVAQRKTEQIKGAQDDIQAMGRQIQEKENRIAQLKKEIDALSKKRAEMEGNLNQVAEKIEKTANDFKETYQYLSDEIKRDIQLINQNI